MHNERILAAILVRFSQWRKSSYNSLEAERVNNHGGTPRYSTVCRGCFSYEANTRNEITSREYFRFRESAFRAMPEKCGFFGDVGSRSRSFVFYELLDLPMQLLLPFCQLSFELEAHSFARLVSPFVK